MSTTVEVTATPSPAQSGRHADGSITELVSGILTDAQKLIRQQAEMLKAEVREDFQQSKRAAEFGALGIVCTTVGVLALTTALAYLLHEQFQFAMWASWGLIGGLFLLAGIVSGVFSYLLLERLNLLPTKTINSLNETMEWKTK